MDVALRNNLSYLADILFMHVFTMFLPKKIVFHQKSPAAADHVHEVQEVVADGLVEAGGERGRPVAA